MRIEAERKVLTPPERFFIEYNDKEFTQFSETGVPTHWLREDSNKNSPDYGRKVELELTSR